MESVAGKKVLFLITKSNWGGAQTYVYMLATQLAAQGADVTVALGGTGLPGAPTGLLAERLAAAGIRTIMLSTFTRDISLMREMRAFTELYRMVREERPDVLHLNSSKAGGLGALVGSLLRVPNIVFTAHGWPHREPRPLLARILIWLVSWATIMFSTKVIVLFKLDYSEAPVFFSRKKLSIVHNGIVQFELRPREEARQELIHRGASASARTWIMMQAELTKNKAVDIGIEAFARVVQKYPDTALIVMGEGEERTKLESKIAALNLSANVFLFGFVADSRTYLSAGDIFLMTSLKEGMPMALLEAGIAGLPVISTKVGGIPEMIRDQKDGLLIDSNDSATLADALISLLDDSQRAQALATSFHDRVLNEFSEEKMVTETVQVYTS